METNVGSMSECTLDKRNCSKNGKDFLFINIFIYIKCITMNVNDKSFNGK